MIVKALLSILFGLINIIFSLINFPDVPDEWYEVIETVFGYFQQPINFVVWMVGSKSFFLGCVTLWILVSNADKIYHMFMWVYRKIRGGG